MSCNKHPKRSRKNCLDCFPNAAEEVVIDSQHVDCRLEINEIIAKALIKFQEKVNSIANIKWEHLHVPMFIFRLELLKALEQEGWVYCDMIRNPAQYNYKNMEDFCILKRIQRDGNVPVPDLLNSTTYQKYFKKGLKK